MVPSPEFLKRLKTLLPESSLLTSAEDCLAYGTDWTKFPGRASIVALPKTTEEVSRVLQLCNELKFPVVPSGGRTGLAGGAVAHRGELVLSLSRMNHLGNVDTVGRTVRVQAGAVTQAVHEHCAPHGLTWPVDLAAKGSCQIGGNLSTNAGGLRVIRYGMTRKWVVGLQAVTARGEIIELNQDLEKNNTGYDLLQLLIGSEGTLAVITEATLKLARLPRHTAVLFFPAKTISSIVDIFHEARQAPFDILAFEFLSSKCLHVVETRLGRKSRLSSKGDFYVVIEIEMPTESRDEAEDWIQAMMDRKIVQDGMLTQSNEQVREVWGLREGITEALQMTPPVKKYDVSVPVRKLVPFLGAIPELIAKRQFSLDLYLFGHMGDGSPHLNLLKPENATLNHFLQDCDRFEKELFQLLKDFGGSISAEHGVGLLKKKWVELSRSPAELRIFRELKRVFDPDGILNPGKYCN